MAGREGCDRRASHRRSLAWDKRGRFSGAWLGGFFRRYFVLWERVGVWIFLSRILCPSGDRGREFRRRWDALRVVRQICEVVWRRTRRERRDFVFRERREQRCRRRSRRDALGR